MRRRGWSLEFLHAPDSTRREASRDSRDGFATLSLRSGIEAEAGQIECLQPEVPSSLMAVGTIQRPAGELHDAVAKRLRGKGQRAGSHHSERSPLGAPSLEHVE